MAPEEFGGFCSPRASERFFPGLADIREAIKGCRLEIAEQLCSQRLGKERDPLRVAGLLHAQGRLARLRRDEEQAIQLLQDSIFAYRKLDVAQGLACGLCQLACAAFEAGRYEEAERYAEESAAIKQELSARGCLGRSFLQLGRAARRKGEGGRALTFYLQAQTLFHEIGFGDGLDEVASGLARLNYDLGDEQFGALWQGQAVWGPNRRRTAA